jgi:hypothetical protein
MHNPVKQATAAGIVWGIGIFIATIICFYNGYARAFLEVMGSLWPGYSITWGGAFAGLIYGFATAFIVVVAAASLSCCMCCCNSEHRKSK